MTLFSASISSNVYLPFSYFFHTASLAPMSRHHKKMVYRVFLDRRGEIVFILASFPPPTFDLIYMYGGHSKTICLGARCQDSLTPAILSWSTAKPSIKILDWLLKHRTWCKTVWLEKGLPVLSISIISTQKKSTHMQCRCESAHKSCDSKYIKFINTFLCCPLV